MFIGLNTMFNGVSITGLDNVVGGVASQKADVKSVFQQAGINFSGRISREELKALLHSIQPDLSDDFLAQACEAADRNGDGIIIYDKFIDWIFGDDA